MILSFDTIKDTIIYEIELAFVMEHNVYRMVRSLGLGVGIVWL
jgi:hypothetical protein